MRERSDGERDGRRAPERGAGGAWRQLPIAAFLALLACDAAALEPLPGAAHLQWSGGILSRTLDDGSVLSEYVAWTDAPDEIETLALSVGFVPRFECSPVIGVRLSAVVLERTGTSVRDGDVVTLVIDGDASEHELVTDTDASGTTLWIDADAESREALRLLIAEGSSAELTLPDGTAVPFSLLGSRRSAAAVEAACRTHEPIPYEGG